MDFSSLTSTNCMAVMQVVAAALCSLLFYWFWRPHNFPPGPRGVPIFGVIPFLNKYAERDFKKWSKNYAPVMSVRLGREDWIVLNDHRSIHQAFVKQSAAFSGRPKLHFFDTVAKGKGIAFLHYGEDWKVQRRFGMLTLKRLGLGKTSTEANVLEGISELVKEIKSHNGEAFDITDALMKSASNIICRVVLGKRFEYDDPTFIELINSLKGSFSDENAGLARDVIQRLPILRHIPPFKRIASLLLGSSRKMIEVVGRLVSEHKLTYKSGEVRDFVDAFLAKMYAKEHKSFEDFQLIMYTRDLFSAGSETVTETIRWALICLIQYPEIQTRLRKEVIDVIGTDTRPSMVHKTKMHYTQAFIQEVFRFRTLLPGSLPHMTNKRVGLAGYSIPARTKVFPNVWGVHNDTDHWVRPEMFKPSRHLNERGEFVKSSHVIPFSIGARHCLGQQLANTEVFLFLVSMLREFHFSFPHSSNLRGIATGSPGVICLPPKSYIRCSCRLPSGNH